MLDDVDLLVCGAGPVGCVVAERAANALGWKVLVIDRRPHVAGNCRDSFHDSGVLVHNYGPHYFRTNDASLVEYLSRFTDWIPANYVVKSLVRGRLFPFPINLTTLEQYFGRTLDVDSAKQLLLKLSQPHGGTPTNSEEYVLSRVGRELYESFYRNYTIKQWRLDPRELEAQVCGRIPIRLNRDPRYVDHRFQAMPRLGFTALFSNMLRHRKIRVLLDCPFDELRELIRPRRATVYAGPIDEYFGNRYGKLPYRSLNFRFVAHRQEYVQSCVQINYPNDFEYTRSVEIKHVTRQRHPETVISYETPTSAGDPFYPIPRSENSALYDRYRELAVAERESRNVYFCGRLAQYRYFNTDEVIQEALKCFQRIRRDCARDHRQSVTSSPPVAA